MVTSTPAAPETVDYLEIRYPATVPELLTPVTGQAGAHGNGVLNPAAGPTQSPGSLYGDEERLARLRDPAVNDRVGNSPLLEDRELYARRRSLMQTSEEPRAESRREIWIPRGEEGAHRSMDEY